jgi:hypothetical protein
MKALKIKSALFALVAITCFLPNASHAATAITVSDNTALFAVTFDIGADDVNYRIPIGAQYGLSTAKSPAYVGYKLFIGDTEVTEIEKTAAIVFGNDVPVVDNTYYEVKAGERKTFTLFTILTVTDKAPSSSHYRIEITKLPYFRDGVRTQLAAESIKKLELESDKVRLNRFD